MYVQLSSHCMYARIAMQGVMLTTVFTLGVYMVRRFERQGSDDLQTYEQVGDTRPSASFLFPKLEAMHMRRDLLLHGCLNFLNVCSYQHYTLKLSTLCTQTSVFTIVHSLTLHHSHCHHMYCLQRVGRLSGLLAATFRWMHPLSCI